MANKHRGELGFEVDGAKHVIRFSANAICELEDDLGLNVKQIGEQMQDADKLRMSTVRTMFCAAMREGEGVDNAAALTVFRRLSPAEAMKIVVDAFALAFSVDGGEGGAENPPTPGKTSDGIGPASMSAG